MISETRSRRDVEEPASPATRTVAAVAATPSKGRERASTKSARAKGSKLAGKKKLATKKKPAAKKKPGAPARVKAPKRVAAVLVIQRKVLADLKSMPVNPRVELRPGMPRYENLKQSIERHGFVDPLVWNRRSGHLVGGWQRRAVLMDMGYPEADVSVVDMDPDQERELNIVLNGVGGEWDYQALAVELQSFDDVTGLGFSAEEIDKIYEEAGLGDDGGGGSGSGSFEKLEQELAGLAGTEDYSIIVIVPVEHADEVKAWLANGEMDTAPGRGRGVMKRCELL